MTDSQERAIIEAVFRAEEGDAIGPLSTPAGHYVLRVERVGGSRRRTLGEVAPEIRELLGAAAHELVTRNCR